MYLVLNTFISMAVTAPRRRFLANKCHALTKITGCEQIEQLMQTYAEGGKVFVEKKFEGLKVDARASKVETNAGVGGGTSGWGAAEWNRFHGGGLPERRPKEPRVATGGARWGGVKAGPSTGSNKWC